MGGRIACTRVRANGNVVSMVAHLGTLADLVLFSRAWRDPAPSSTSVAVQSWMRRVLWALIVAAFVVRVWIIVASIGSEDARLWEGFATHISERGLIATYENRGDFNHPPAMAMFGWLSLEIAQALQTRFSLVFKVPFLVADAATAWLLWKIWLDKGESRATAVVALFSTSLVSILVAAYHCNTDTLCATFCLASAFAVHKKRWGWAGLLLGAAINVKLVPVMLIPVLTAFLPSRGALLRLGAGLAAWAIPFAILALLAPSELLNNVLSYGSNPFQWGVIYFMQQSQATLPRVSGWIAQYYVENGRYILLASMVCLGVLQRWRRTLNAFEAGALSLAVFMVLIPGFGIQYLVWPVPLMFAAHPGWATRYSVTAGVFAFLVYYLFWTQTSPWFSHFAMRLPPPTPLLGLLAWALLCGYTAIGFRKLYAA